MERPVFANDHIYHIYNRGVEKRLVFLEERDYFRFVAGLYVFNDVSPVLNLGFSFVHTPIEVRLQYGRKEPFVEILAFTLMPNHYHLMLRQRKENGITEFMRKLGTGYTNYFNLKYRRVGPLFQGKFKAVCLEHEAHFQYLPHYIHLNPLDLSIPAWREQGVEDFKKAFEFLLAYRWSSFLDYLGRRNFPSVTERGFLTEYIGGPKEFRASAREWLQMKDLGSIREVALEL